VTAVRLGWRSSIALAAASAVGAIGFLWPLVAPGFAVRLGSDHRTDAPWLFVVLVSFVVVLVAAELSDGVIDVKAVAVLGVLATFGAALRPLGGGVTGISPVFFLLVPAGRVLGRGFGFTLGLVTMAASALLTTGVGPWLPFQMVAAGWIGFGAGCLPPLRGRAEVWMLAAYGAVVGIAFGALMNLWFWPYATTGSGLGFDASASVLVNVRHYLAFYLATSVGFDIARAAGNVVFVVATARPVLSALRRVARRASFGASAEFGTIPA
jgi:energy-coupling factor transport system substrate-specific component